MLLKTEWIERFVAACSEVRSTRQRTLAAGHAIYATVPEGRCWVVKTGYVKLLDPGVDGNRFIRLILGRGGLFGDRPFGGKAFRGFVAPNTNRRSPTGRPKSSRWIVRNSRPQCMPEPNWPTMVLESVTARAIPRTTAPLAVHHTDPGPCGRHAPRPDLLRRAALQARSHDRRPPEPRGLGGTRRRGAASHQRRTRPDAARRPNRVHTLLLLRGRPRGPPPHRHRIKRSKFRDCHPDDSFSPTNWLGTPPGKTLGRRDGRRCGSESSGSLHFRMGPPGAEEIEPNARTAKS